MQSGKKCTRACAPDSTTCRVHTPGYQETVSQRAKAAFEERYVEWEVEKLLLQTELGQEIERLKLVRRDEWYWLEQQRKDSAALLNEVKKAKDVVAKMCSLERLEEIYQVAKSQGDAATMHDANKSMYYAKKKAGLA